MNINQKMEELHQNLIGIIGLSELPIGICYYIAKDVLGELEQAYFASLNIKQSQEEKEEEECQE